MIRVLEEYIKDFQDYVENPQINHPPFIEKEQLLSWLKELEEYRNHSYEEMQRKDAEDYDFDYRDDVDEYGWMDDYEYYESESSVYTPEKDILNAVFFDKELTDVSIQVLMDMRHNKDLSEYYEYLIYKFRDFKNIAKLNS